MREIVVHTILIGSAFSTTFFGLYATLNATGQVIQRVVLLRTPAWKHFYQKKKGRNEIERCGRPTFVEKTRLKLLRIFDAIIVFPS